MEIKLDKQKVPFSLDYSLDCGQLFRWQKLGDWWYGVAADKVIKIKQNEEGLIFEAFPDAPNREFIESYLRLDDDLPSIFAEISKDEHIREAVRRFCGLRLIRQEPWECLISYICATYKSIPAIKKMVNSISRCYGKKLTFDGIDFYTFPKPSTLAQLNCQDLRSCGLGFRAERVIETAKRVDSKNMSLEALKPMDYPEAKQELLCLPGVGHKVADCVLLFSLEKLDAFPIDVWMKRAATRLYASHFDDSFIKRVTGKGSITSKEYATIAQFGREYFGTYAGYAQEYLFHYLRTQQR
ncbi:MAG: 8-oxoguanine DNA glycosylase [Candidatus Bathyarchaeum sp.]|nr:MAG: 8-oxoguanine DNA glycosylase [Candidatus Bathyarchaeum sp.]